MVDLDKYDSPEWHRKMAEEGHLYQAVIGGTVVGAAVLFEDREHRRLLIGRIVIDSPYHRKGYGTLLMQCIEDLFPSAREIDLDTPPWNARTNAFYQKLGYDRVKAEDGFAFYRKVRT